MRGSQSVLGTAGPWAERRKRGAMTVVRRR